VSVVCCLGAGFASRAFTWQSRRELPPSAQLSHVAQAEHALVSFAERIGAPISDHSNWYKSARIDSDRYSRAVLLPYWDETGYQWHPHYKPFDEQVQQRERLFDQRPHLRSKKKTPAARSDDPPPAASAEGERLPAVIATGGAGTTPAGSTPAGA